MTVDRREGSLEKFRNQLTHKLFNFYYNVCYTYSPRRVYGKDPYFCNSNNASGMSITTDVCCAPELFNKGYSI